MAQEFVQFQDSQPSINPPSVGSRARGKQNIAQVLGEIGSRSMSQAADYQSEVSKAHLLQTHSMIQDVEANSKLEMFKNPQHATTIAENADSSINQIKGAAKLSPGDRRSLENSSSDMVRSLNLSAQEKQITLARDQAKFATLSTFDNTLQTIKQQIITNPDGADKLIEAQYEALQGKVTAGILTPVEANKLHKQLVGQLSLAEEMMQGMRDGVLDASDLNALHALDTAHVPMMNAGLPIDHHTALVSDHHYGQLTLRDVKAKYSNGGIANTRDLSGLKGEGELDAVLNYGKGAVRATGDITSCKDWSYLTTKLDTLRKKDNKSLTEEGYFHRLNNFMIQAKVPGAYQNFIASTPEGARIWDKYKQQDALVQSSVPFGDEQQSAMQKHQMAVDNLNELISKSNAVGIGMNYPDHLRQPIPLGFLKPIVDSFEKGADIRGAIQNMSILNAENKVYAMNAFPDDYRKQLTVYQVGQLGMGGDSGFLRDLMKSQQNGALTGGEKGVSAQEKYLQLETDKDGYSDKKLAAKIKPALAEFTPWLRMQPNGVGVESAQLEQAMRYVKYVGAQHGDYKLANINDYLKDYSKNMNEAYKVVQGSNYTLDKNNVPLEENEMKVLASHAVNVTREKLLKTMIPAQVDDYLSENVPSLVSSPGGRITVVKPNGETITDENGQPTYNEIYGESVWRAAEMDKSAAMASSRYAEIKPLKYSRGKLPQLWRKSSLPAPVTPGNIDLDKREKVWNPDGSYSTVRTMTIEEDGKTILLPTIINGKQVSEDAAIANYHQTGDHLGIFKSDKEAQKYDENMHRRMKWMSENGQLSSGKKKLTKDDVVQAIDERRQSKDKTGADIKNLTEDFKKSKEFKASGVSGDDENLKSSIEKVDTTKLEDKDALKSSIEKIDVDKLEDKPEVIARKKDEEVVNDVLKTLHAKEGDGSGVEGDVETGGSGVTESGLSDIGDKRKIEDIPKSEYPALSKRIVQAKLKQLKDATEDFDSLSLSIRTELLDAAYSTGAAGIAKAYNKEKDKGLTAVFKRIALKKSTREGQTLGGLGVRRAKAYNVAAKIENKPLIKYVEQTANELIFKDEDGKEMFTVHKKMHESGKVKTHEVY